MSDSILVGVGQFAPGSDLEANLMAIDELAGRAAAQGARVVVFPEYSSFFEAQMSAAFVAAAQPLDGRFVDGLADVARRLGIHVVAGLVETADSTHFSNTLVAVDPSGSILATYRKLHLYDAFGQRESDWVLAGPLTPPETFEVDGFTVGLQTCYDIRFPEVSRILVDAGAEIVLVPAEWVRGPLKEHHWRTLLAARAIENTIYIAAADHMPPVGVGNSLVVDPSGVVVAGVGDEHGVAVGEIRRDRLESVREVNPALKLRRFRVVEG